jgi:hypothetical protein
LLSVINTSCHAYFRLSVNIWRYLEGAKPLQERKTPEVKTTYFMDYEKNKRTRSYLSEWEQSRSWLLPCTGNILLSFTKFSEFNVFNILYASELTVYSDFTFAMAADFP